MPLAWICWTTNGPEMGARVGIAINNEDLVTDIVVVEKAAQVLATTIVVNNGLAALAE